MNPGVIVIDGKSYNSVDEMPPDVRQKYEQAMRSLQDTDGDAVPDMFENANILADRDQDGIPDVLKHLTASNSVLADKMKIFFEDREFNSIENLPPEVRARYEQAMSKLDANRNGVPDFLEGMMNVNTPNLTTNLTTRSGIETPAQASPTPIISSPPISANSAITPDISNGWMLALAGLFLFLLCAAGAVAVWYFFIRV